MATLLVFTVPGTGACQQGPPCTLVGCEDGITAQIGPDVLAGADGEITVETCADGTCHPDRVDPALSPHGVLTGVPAPGLSPGDEVTVTVTVTDEAGAVLADVRERITMERSQPNGPDCGPGCVVGGVTVGATADEPGP